MVDVEKGVRGVAGEARVKRYLAMGLGNIRASSFGFFVGTPRSA
jgi:hypothetical protein